MFFLQAEVVFFANRIIMCTTFAVDILQTVVVLKLLQPEASKLNLKIAARIPFLDYLSGVFLLHFKIICDIKFLCLKRKNM